MPEVHVDSRDRLASARVDELDVEVERDALLTVGDIAANQLAIDVVRTLSDLGLQNASGVVREEKCLIVAVRDAGSRLVRGVVGSEVAADQGAGQTSLDTGFLGDFLTTSESGLGDASASEFGST